MALTYRGDRSSDDSFPLDVSAGWSSCWSASSESRFDGWNMTVLRRLRFCSSVDPPPHGDTALRFVILTHSFNPSPVRARTCRKSGNFFFVLRKANERKTVVCVWVLNLTRVRGPVQTKLVACSRVTLREICLESACHPPGIILTVCFHKVFFGAEFCLRRRSTPRKSQTL